MSPLSIIALLPTAIVAIFVASGAQARECSLGLRSFHHAASATPAQKEQALRTYKAEALAQILEEFSSDWNELRSIYLETSHPNILWADYRKEGRELWALLYGEWNKQSDVYYRISAELAVQTRDMSRKASSERDTDELARISEWSRETQAKYTARKTQMDKAFRDEWQAVDAALKAEYRERISAERELYLKTEEILYARRDAQKAKLSSLTYEDLAEYANSSSCASAASVGGNVLEKTTQERIQETVAKLPPEVRDRVLRAAGNADDLKLAISLISKYRKLAIEWGDDDKAHERAAYEWGYEVGNPHIIGMLRVAGETSQFFYYTVEDLTVRTIPGGNKGRYQPYLWSNENGGLRDGIKDIRISKQGAEDRAAGRPNRYGG